METDGVTQAEDADNGATAAPGQNPTQAGELPVATCEALPTAEGAKRRRVWLRTWLLPAGTVLSATLSVLVGFVVVPPQPAIRLVQYGGYYVMLAGFVACVVALVRLWLNRDDRPCWGTADWKVIGASIFFALLWQVNEPHGFKVLMDEFVLNATSMSMHFDREIFVPLKVHEIDSLPIVLGGIVDKRPNFFPFLVSLVHDVSGYRTGNVFWLNGGLSVLLLFLAGRLGRRIGGKENAGLLVVALLGGLPLLALNATSASFEVLNLTMICACMLLACRFLDRTNERNQDALVCCAVLLAQTRYESALFVGAVAIVVLWGWFRRRAPVWSWSLPLAPVLLILVPLQSKVFAVNPKGYWQLTNGNDQPFAFKFVYENIGHAVQFLFTVDGFQTASPVLSAMGLVCMIFVVVFLLRRWRKVGSDAELTTFSLFGLVVLGNFALLLCYYWGQLDDFVATRLALPLLLFFALASAFSLGRWIKRPSIWIPVLAVPAAWAFIAGVSFSSRATSTNMFLTFQETRWERDFVRAHHDEHALFVMASPLPAINERKAAISTEVLAERPELMAKHLELGSYATVYVFQRLQFDAAKQVWREYAHSELGPEFVLETIEERRFKPLFKTRLSRLRAVDLSRQLPRPADWQPKYPLADVLKAGSDAGPSERYVQEFLASLP